MTPAAGYVYVAALSNGTVKVGRSQDAVKRLAGHKTNARTLGLTVADSWTSPLHLEWLSNEDALKKIAADLGGVPEGREAFSGIEFAAVVEKARDLTFTDPEPKQQPDRRLIHGRLTPRERAVALAAVEVGMSEALAALLNESTQGLPVTVVAFLDAGITTDWVESLAPEGDAPPVAYLAEAMRTVIRFECAVESVLARKKADALRREAASETYNAKSLREMADA